MINQDDAEIGATVWLRAHTKVAPPECYLRLAAVLVDVKAEWPMVKVRVFDAKAPDEGREIKVHRDNIGLNPKVVKKEKGGDMVGSAEDGPAGKIRTMGTPVPNVDGQDVLF
jgi:hypothetical protein